MGTTLQDSHWSHKPEVPLTLENDDSCATSMAGQIVRLWLRHRIQTMKGECTSWCHLQDPQ